MDEFLDICGWRNIRIIIALLRNVHVAFAAFRRGMEISYESFPRCMWLFVRNLHGSFAEYPNNYGCFAECTWRFCCISSWIGISYESVPGRMWLLCGMYMALLRNIPGSFAEYLWPFAESSWLFCGM